MFAFLYRARGGVTLEEIGRAMSPHFQNSPQYWIAPGRDFAIGWSAPAELAASTGTPHLHSAVAIALGEICEHASGDNTTRQFAKRLLARGEAAVHEVFGEFAVLRWDGANPAVTVGTDHQASQSVYYAQTASGFTVATSLPLLLSLPGTPSTLDATNLALLTAGQMGSQDDSTAYAHIRKVRGGELLELRHGVEPRAHRWWHPERIEERRIRDPRECTERLRSLFSSAVECRLPASGPAGVTLSGGLDSTLVAGYAAMQLAPQGRTLHAWTSVPDPTMQSESRPGWDASDWDYAAMVAQQHPNIQHEAVTPGGLCILDVLQEVCDRSATPVRNSANAVWIRAISLLARARGMRTVLTGMTGNATISFSGQGGLAGLVRTGKWAQAFRHLRSLPSGHRGAAAETLIQLLLGERTGSRIWYARAARGQQLDHLTEILRPVTVGLYHRQIAPRAGSLADRRYRVEFATRTKPSFVADYRLHAGATFVDPTADRRLVEYLLSLPSHAFLGEGHTRLQARRLGEGVLPEQVRWRRTRGAQAPEAAGYFQAHAQRFRDTWGEIRDLPMIREFVDVPAAERVLETLISSGGSSLMAATMFRVFHVGMFIRTAERRWGATDMVHRAA